jgi:tetratricopeptide (TPR) repeat protein
LLNDGGYHQEAFQQLQGKRMDDFALPEDKTEFAYRLARIHEDLGQLDEAIENYLITIKLGQGQKEYFAARAALQLGWIYEKKQDLPEAMAYFENCLAMKDHEYKNSLDQKAKAGIARCQGR